MASIFHSLLMVIAGSTQKELARQIKYLKTENEILRAKLPGRITVTQKERQRLLKFGANLGAALRSIITIVTPVTFLRWTQTRTSNASSSPSGKNASTGSSSLARGTATCWCASTSNII